MPSMRDGLNKWLDKYGVSHMHSDVSVMEQITESDRILISRYSELVKDYAQRGEPALDKFVDWLLSQPRSVIERFMAVNNLPIELPTKASISALRPIITNNLRTYMVRPGVKPTEAPILPISQKITMQPAIKLPPELVGQIKPAFKEPPLVVIPEPVKLGGKSPVCDAMPPQTTTQMMILSEKSTENGGEFGGALGPDMQLSNIMEGTGVEVGIPRSADTIGTFHCHPFGNPNPSVADIQDIMTHNDKIMCIGSTGKPGTKIKCFTPNEPAFTQLRQEYNELVNDIVKFNKKVKDLYPYPKPEKRRPGELPQIPAWMSEEEYLVRTLREQAAGMIYDPEAQAEAENQAKQADAEAKRLEDEANRLRDAAIVSEEPSDESIAEDTIAKAWMARTHANELHKQTTEIKMRPNPDIAQQEQAIDILNEGAELVNRRDKIKSEFNNEAQFLAYTEKQRPQVHTPEGWKPKELVLNDCRLIWETLEGELPYETEKGEIYYGTSVMYKSGDKVKVGDNIYDVELTQSGKVVDLTGSAEYGTIVMVNMTEPVIRTWTNPDGSTDSMVISEAGPRAYTPAEWKRRILRV